MISQFQVTALTLLVSFGLITGCRSYQNTVINKTDNLQTPVAQTVAETNSNLLDITVSIPPQQYFVEKIGGDRVRVNIMVLPGSDLHNYEPKPQQLQALSDAEAYITIGVPFENGWMDRIKSANPQMIIIDSAQGIEPLPSVEHGHGNADHHHAEETTDPHIWLSPRLAKIQAQNIYQGLVKADPQHQTEYQKNLNQFLTEIDQLDQQIRQNLASLQNRKFMVFHPAWGYFAKDYNLEQEAIEVGGQEPSAAELANLITQAKQDNIKVIFAQPELSHSSAKAIAQEIGGEVLLISDLDPNWAENLLKVSKTFAEELNQDPSQ